MVLPVVVVDGVVVVVVLVLLVGIDVARQVIQLVGEGRDVLGELVLELYSLLSRSCLEIAVWHNTRNEVNSNALDPTIL